MNKTMRSALKSVLLSTVLTAPVDAGAHQHVPARHASLPHYVLFDVGSFGGGFGQFCYLGCGAPNSRGHAVGIDATSLPDPFDPLCFYDCHVDHSLLWKNGGTNDLGSLEYGLSSFATSINDKDWAIGLSQNGKIDPATGFFEVRAVLWKHGKIRSLHTLGGTQSQSVSINLPGQVAIDSSTSNTNDPFINVPQANCLWLPTTGGGCSQNDFGTNVFFLPVASQTHGAMWSPAGGVADLGTLGGPDSAASGINDAGQIVGYSYTSDTAGPSGVPDTHAFLWENGTMTDLGTLGGTFGVGFMINNSGVVAGAANLPGDTALHPFLWDGANGMRDLGTLGGTYAHPDWLNENGDVVGFSRTADHLGRAFYWHNGAMTNLGTLGDDANSEATGVNNDGLIVGLTFEVGADLRGWISDHGDPPVDLNALVRKPHGLYIVSANGINDAGVITANAATRNGALHPVVLVPEDDFDLLARMKVNYREPAATASSDGPVSRPARISFPACHSQRRLRLPYCER